VSVREGEATGASRPQGALEELVQLRGRLGDRLRVPGHTLQPLSAAGESVRVSVLGRVAVGGGVSDDDGGKKISINE